MNAPELASLQKVDTEYRELSVEIKDSYRGDWDDAVHRSYPNMRMNCIGGLQQYE